MDSRGTMVSPETLAVRKREDESVVSFSKAVCSSAEAVFCRNGGRGQRRGQQG